MKENNIVVRITNDFDNHKIGTIDKIIYIRPSKNLEFKISSIACDYTKYRLATPEEIIFYNNGGRNINDMNKEINLIPNQYYYCIYDTVHEYIFKSNGHKYTLLANYIHLHNLNFAINNFSNTQGSLNKVDLIRPATQEEIDWLNECIKQNKFVPKESIKSCILPEKWYIHPNNELERLSICKYFDNFWTNSPESEFYKKNGTLKQLYHYKQSKGDVLYNNPINGYTEITFEQFKKYVLDYNPVQESINQSKVSDEQFNKKKIPIYALCIKSNSPLFRPGINYLCGENSCEHWFWYQTRTYTFKGDKLCFKPIYSKTIGEYKQEIKELQLIKSHSNNHINIKVKSYEITGTKASCKDCKILRSTK